MAELYKTAAEHFNDLAGAAMPEDQNVRERGAQAVDTGASISTGGTAVAPPATGGSTSTIGTASDGAMGASYLNTPPTTINPHSVRDYAPNPAISQAYGRYFDPVTEGLKQQYSTLKGAEGAFYTGAGTSRNYQGIGGEETLRKAITQGNDPVLDIQEINAARPLVGAQYLGPASLGQDSIDQITKSYQELLSRKNAMASAGGLEAIIQEQVPGLTAGQLRYEADRLSRDPEFQASRRGAELDVNRFLGDLLSSEKASTDYASQRTAEEAGIASSTDAYLRGQLGETTGLLNADVSAKQKQMDLTTEAFSKLLESGDLHALLGAPGVAQFETTPAGALVPGGPADIQGAITATPELGQITAGQKVRADIMAKYPELAKVPLMVLGVSSHGKERLEFPSDWFAKNQENYTPQEMQNLKAQATKRQLELEKEFAIGTGRRDQQPTITQEGQYSRLLPMYFGGDFQPQDVRDYTAFDPGVRPSIANISTEAQKFQINAIHDLLGEMDRLVTTGEPYKAAQIAIDLKTYLDQEASTLASSSKKLTANRNTWQKAVNDARRAYDGSVFSRAFGDISQEIMGSRGLGEAFGGTIDAVGQGDWNRAFLNAPFKVAGAGISGPLSGIGTKLQQNAQSGAGAHQRIAAVSAGSGKKTP